MSKLLNLNWSAILLAILIAIIGWQFYSISSERDDYFNQLTTERNERKIAAAKAESKHAQQIDEGKRNMAVQKAQHLADIQHIGKQYGKVINNDQNAITYRNAVIKQLRNQLAADDSSRVRQDDAGQSAGENSNGATIRIGEESADFYRSAYLGQREHIKTLKEAGAICAADYNSCYKYVKSEQGRLGVEK